MIRIMISLYDIISHKGSIQHREEFSEHEKAVYRVQHLKLIRIDHLTLLASVRVYLPSTKLQCVLS